MKEEAVIRKLESLAKRIEKKGVVNRAYRVARDCGKGRTETRDSFTSLKYEFGGNSTVPNLRVSLHDGYTMFGGGRVIVYDGEEIVLKCERYCDDKKPYAVLVNDFNVEVYKPGKWEFDLRKVEKSSKSNVSAKAVEKHAKKIVDSAVLEDLLSRLPLKF